MDSRFDEAVDVTQRALMLDPGSPELLGNLAIAHLLADDVPAAEKAIAAAVQHRVDDPVNAKLEALIRGVASGEFERPTTMIAAMRPPKRAKRSTSESSGGRKPWWKLW